MGKKRSVNNDSEQTDGTALQDHRSNNRSERQVTVKCRLKHRKKKEDRGTGRICGRGGNEEVLKKEQKN